jgi:hypothetical protein
VKTSDGLRTEFGRKYMGEKVGNLNGLEKLDNRKIHGQVLS